MGYSIWDDVCLWLALFFLALIAIGTCGMFYEQHVANGIGQAMFPPAVMQQLTPPDGTLVEPESTPTPGATMPTTPFDSHVPAPSVGL